MMHAITTGGRESAYGKHGLNRYSMRIWARNRIKDLERLLIKEQEGYDETRDMGWDTTALREDFASIAPTGDDST